jgi:iron complex transport system substrate-binding protein
MRIVSLLASATEIVCELGLEDALVGISHECDGPPAILDRPRVSRARFDPSGLTSGQIDAAVRRAMADFGSVYEVDGKLLEELEPDLVLTQAVCEVCAVPTPGVLEVVGERGLDAEVLSLDAHSLEDILDSVVQVGEAAGVAERARRVREGLAARLDEVRASVAGAPPRRVLAIEWLDPPFVPGHWVPEMVASAGGLNLAGEAGRPSRQVEWEELGGLDPDVLVVMPCGYGLEASRREAEEHAARLLEVAPRAIESGRAYVVDGSSYFNRSGPRAVTGVEILAGLLHPERADAPPEGTAGSWEPAGMAPR